MDINKEDIKLQLDEDEVLDVAELAAKYNVKERYIIYAYAVANGMSHAQATKHIGVKNQQYTWEYRTKHPEVDMLINLFSKQIITSLNGKAIETMTKLLNDKSSSVRFNAAKYVIDRNLGGEEMNLNINKPKDAVDLLLEEIVGKKEDKDDGDK